MSLCLSSDVTAGAKASQMRLPPKHWISPKRRMLQARMLHLKQEE